MVSSIFFLGGIVGLFISSYTLDRFGRKLSSITWTILLVLSSLLGLTYPPSYTILVVVRFLQGATMYPSYAANYLLLLECFPSSHANTANTLVMLAKGASSAIFALTAALVTYWEHYHIAVAVICVVILIPYAYTPESPQWYLVHRRDEEAAKQCLKTLFRINGGTTEFLDKVKILPPATNDCDKDTSFKQWNKVMLSETLALLYIWMICSMGFHAFNFGCVTIFPDPYVGYTVIGFIEVISGLTWTYLASRVGRRWTMAWGFLMAAFCMFAALINVPILGNWTVSNISSLVGKFFMYIPYCGIFLWTGEIPPASHAGFIFSIGSSAGRVGGFFAPLMFGVLSQLTSNSVPLVLMGGLQIIGGVISACLVETRGIPKVLTPGDVVKRRREQKLRCFGRQ
eukprot:sb/3465389/